MGPISQPPTIPSWATQSSRWWPALLLLRRVGECRSSVWDHVSLGADEGASVIDFEALVEDSRSWSWQEWRLVRLARALHRPVRDVDVIELVEGLDQGSFRLALEAIASAGPVE